MKRIFLFQLLLLEVLYARRSKVGGQAIIEGVMMRNKQKISWAVRKSDSSVFLERTLFVSLVKRYKILSLPLFRGAINLFESMRIGYTALSRSAEIASDSKSLEQNKKTDSPIHSNITDKMSSILSIIIALSISIGLFMYIPMLVAQVFFKDTPYLFNLAAGVLRIFLFVLYLFFISMWKDIRRIFEYHGAEHMAIFAFEDEKELTLENMRQYGTLHPRCGTSFLLLVALVCIFLFSIIDSLFQMTIGSYPNVLTRLLVHLLLIPIISGISYEVLRFSGKHQNVSLISFLTKPGLWLQKITTRKPDDSQLQIAATALKATL